MCCRHGIQNNVFFQRSIRIRTYYAKLKTTVIVTGKPMGKYLLEFKR